VKSLCCAANNSKALLLSALLFHAIVCFPAVMRVYMYTVWYEAPPSCYKNTYRILRYIPKNDSVCPHQTTYLSEHLMP